MIDLIELQLDLGNWVPLSEVSKLHPHFSSSQIRRLFWKRHEHAGLLRCYRQVGRTGYVCLPLFALWVSGVLPEQE